MSNVKHRLAALLLPLALLLPAGGAAAATPECGLIGAVLLDIPCTVIDPLMAAQDQWDTVADVIGRRATRHWLGPRPKSVDDLVYQRPVLLPPLF